MKTTSLNWHELWTFYAKTEAIYTRCGNCGIFLQQFCRKTSVKLTLLKIDLTKKNCAIMNFSFSLYFGTHSDSQCGNCCDLCNLTHFLQKFRETNVFTKKKLLKSWFDEIFFWFGKTWNSHSLTTILFSSNQLFSSFFS